MKATENNLEFQQQLTLEQQNFQQRVSYLVINVSVLWQKYTINACFPENIAQELIHSINSIALASAEFGYANINRLANQSKNILSIILSEKRQPNEDEISLLTNKIKEMHKPVSSLSNNPVFGANLISTTNQYNELIYLVSENVKYTEALTVGIKSAGFDVLSFNNFTDFHRVYEGKIPTIIICDTCFDNNSNAGTEEIAKLNIAPEQELPILFVSLKDDISTKLSCVRAGGSHFFAKNVSTNIIIDTLLSITNAKQQLKLRVLLVDDDRDILSFLNKILDSDKFYTKTQHDPLEVLTTITDFSPEVLVLDNYMPGCTGFELAKIIRQNPDFHDLPIVFLSAEEKRDKQLQGMDIGADDFLIKPVEPDYFNRLIYARASRTRQIKGMEYERSLKAREANYLQIAMDQHSIVSATDAVGNIIFANEKFCEISGYSLYELLGKTHSIVNSGVHEKVFFEEMWQQISGGEPWHGEVCNRTKNGEIYWVKSTIVPFLDENQLPYQYISIRTDITLIKAAEESARQAEALIKKQQALLDTIRVAITEFVDSVQTKNVAKTLLPDLLNLTGSQCGFIGAIHNEGTETIMLTQAMTTTKWNDGEHKSYDLNKVGGPVFSQIDELLNLSIYNGEVVISNDPINDSRITIESDENSTTPDSYLGIPIIYGNETVGMFGLANRPLGYDQSVIEFLQPFTLTYGVIIHAQKMAIQDLEQRYALVESREAAENANRAKSLFLSNMSHELRTPLNAILGFNQLLAMDDKNHPLNELQIEAISETKKAGEHLLDLISDILDLSQIETGIVNLDVSSFSLKEMLVECQSMMLPLAEEKTIQLNFEFKNISLRSDRQRLKQVLINLISNAIKYNKPNGKVDVTVDHPDQDLIRIGVKDTGIGIPQNLQENLFQSFQRLGAEKTKIQGTGIGLVIVKSMVEYLKGNISFESKEGQGTQFWIVIPCELSTDMPPT